MNTKKNARSGDGNGAAKGAVREQDEWRVRVSPSLYKMVKQAAESQGMSASAFIRGAVIRALRDAVKPV
jgi:uncharacterized protein (DUF1778 family)